MQISMASSLGKENGGSDLEVAHPHPQRAEEGTGHIRPIPSNLQVSAICYPRSSSGSSGLIWVNSEHRKHARDRRQETVAPVAFVGCSAKERLTPLTLVLGKACIIDVYQWATLSHSGPLVSKPECHQKAPTVAIAHHGTHGCAGVGGVVELPAPKLPRRLISRC